MSDKQNYSSLFKRMVVNEVESGKISKEVARFKYGIKGHSSILDWQREFAKIEVNKTMSKSINKMNETELKIYIKELESKLKTEEERSYIYKLYSEELEKEVSKQASKKYVIGQSDASRHSVE